MSGHRAWRHVTDRAAPRPAFFRPILLDVGDRLRGLSAEHANEPLQHLSLPRLGFELTELTGAIAYNEAEHHAAASIGRRIVIGNASWADRIDRLATEPAVAPERALIDGKSLNRRPVRHPLNQLIAIDRQQRLPIDVACERRRDSNDHGARLQLAAACVNANASFVMIDPADRRFEQQRRLQLLDKFQRQTL